MDDKIYTQVFEKITLRGIKESEETMAFLKNQATEIFHEFRENWERNQNPSETLDPELAEQFLLEAVGKLQKYLYRWFSDVSYTISLRAYEKTLPREIVEIFRDYIDTVVNAINFDDLSWELMNKIFDDHYKLVGVK